MNKEQIQPEEATAINRLEKERNIAALLMRIVNEEAPVRKAAREAISRIVGEEVDA